jgi:epoxyqueuosine reductase
VDAAELKRAIIAEANSLGFDVVRFTRAELPDSVGDGLDTFLAAEHHGDMAWLARNPERRRHPQGLWPEARSVIVLGTNYGPIDDPLNATKRKDRAAISVYAQGTDYHDVIKKRLKALGRWLHKASGAELKVFVDTAPVMEKPLAEVAGVGWQGKHTNLVSRTFGSWLFLGEIFTACVIEPDPLELDHCGSCHACLDACPTHAFPAPYSLDARRCISYLTIEHEGVIAPEFRAAIGNRIYGCDDCLAVCPWNKFAQATKTLAFQPRDELRGPRLADLAGLDDAAFRTLFSGSPIKRIGRDRFVRNVLIAIGNSGDPALIESAEARLDDSSPLVRGMAVWALRRLDITRAIRQDRSNTEPDATVLAEWASLA